MILVASRLRQPSLEAVTDFWDSEVSIASAKVSIARVKGSVAAVKVSVGEVKVSIADVKVSFAGVKVSIAGVKVSIVLSKTAKTSNTPSHRVSAETLWLCRLGQLNCH